MTKVWQTFVKEITEQVVSSSVRWLPVLLLLLEKSEEIERILGKKIIKAIPVILNGKNSEKGFRHLSP